MLEETASAQQSHPDWLFCTRDEMALQVTQVWQTNALAKTSAGSTAACVYIFDHPDLHVHLGPHLPHDALNHQIIRGEMVSNELASGLQRDISKDFPIIAEHMLHETASRIRSALA